MVGKMGNMTAAMTVYRMVALKAMKSVDNWETSMVANWGKLKVETTVDSMDVSLAENSAEKWDDLKADYTAEKLVHSMAEHWADCWVAY